MKNLIMKVSETLSERLIELIPNLLAGIIVLLAAYVLIRIVLRMTRRALDRMLSSEEQAIRSFWIKLMGGFLWFSVLLILLNVLGMQSLAASLGTAAGFAALGVSYAMKDIFSDLVAGLYLIRDDDFQPGDRISTDVVTGKLKSIEFRKCRFIDDDGNDVVVANTDIEKKWIRVRNTREESTLDEKNG